MSKVLYINSSARNNSSLSRQLSGEFVAKLAAQGNTVVERDLAAQPVPHLTEEVIGAFFTPPDQRGAEAAFAVKLSDTLVDELLAADVLVLAAPMYNFSVPSTLKAWIDHVARVGRTFQYTATGPVGLATGKKAYIFTSSGGIYSEGPAAAYDYLSTYLRTALGFIGITDISFIQTEGVSRGDEALANALAKTRASIAALAA
ncbi:MULTISPECIES: FMN-dependent NADH-azoreductase [unclassified Janthinobacterium]|uniref:FMN-dependent NADH-azoreductase n=1 Tax=unclassified Janthinobacterium TaxID=2610881 RepID=UPI001620C91F|nr:MULTISPECIES: FMN-dependent NADH-azoreductase [unclassified Janthinobacterium]MBB5369593.1 FMN-dependent NADH-azoreductase [Janthinobacterium sp. K2C7]MBB5382451.1 FMN-dependent NADH-azoreductase [Janthinobacterium sp. K2Li3]MBB5388028.1 FMN-dependent NADH-azoreductase [Janthinobacterium sp. K2E3]